MKRALLIALILTASLVGSEALSATSYTDEADFLTQIQAGYYLEDFSGYSYGNPLDGNQTDWDYGPVGGFSWHAYAPQGLWSNPSALSTNNANDALILTFTGDAVTACGAVIASTDINGNVIAQTISATLDDGTVVSHTGTGFAGFTTTLPMVSLTIDGVDSPANNWAQIDHFYVGAAAGGATATPTPTPVMQTATPTPPLPTATPTRTPLPPTATPAPASPTPTPPPIDLGVRIEMPNYVYPGEVFSVRAYLDNPGPALLYVPTTFVLEVFEEYWFWPSWCQFCHPHEGDLDYQLLEVPVGTTPMEVIPAFTWPDTGSAAATGLVVWGAMLSDDLRDYRGAHARVEWGYGPR